MQTNHKGAKLSPTHKQAIESLFRANFGQLLDLAAENRTLTPAQPEEIVGWVAYCLEIDPVSTPTDGFMDWASSIILPLREMYALKNLYRRYVYDGIWRMMHGYTDLLDAPDLSVPPIERPLTGIDEIAQTTWIWAFENMAELIDPTVTGCISARLNEVSYWFSRTWVTAKLRERGYKPKKKGMDGIADKAPFDTDMDGIADKGQSVKRKIITFPELWALRGEPEETATLAEPDDAAALSEAIDNLVQFKPKKKRSKRDDADSSEWGIPTIGAWMLCRLCNQSVRRVASVDGPTASLSCGHSRTSRSYDEGRVCAEDILLAA